VDGLNPPSAGGLQVSVDSTVGVGHTRLIPTPAREPYRSTHESNAPVCRKGLRCSASSVDLESLCSSSPAPGSPSVSLFS